MDLSVERDQQVSAADVEARHVEPVLALLVDAGAILGSSLDVETALHRIARLATASLADWCAIDLVDTAGRVRRVAAAHVDPRYEADVQQLIETFPPDPARPHPLWQTLRAGRPTLADGRALIPALAQTAEHARLLDRLGRRAMLVVPLAMGTRTLGALTLVRSSAYAQEDVTLAEALAHQCAGALDNARLCAAEQAARAAAERAADRMAHLQAVTAALALALTRDQIAEVVLDQAVAALGAQAGAIAVSSDDGAALELIHSSGRAQASWDHWRRLPIAAPVPLAEVFRSGEAVWVDEPEVVNRYPTLASVQAAEAFGMMAGLPLLAGDRSIGALGFRFPRGRLVDDDDRAFALTLAEECAQALERARLYGAERQARAHAERLAAERAAILGQIADGVVIADQHGRITFANASARRYFGQTGRTTVTDRDGVSYSVPLHPGVSSPEELPLARAALHGERVDEVELQIQRPDGTTVLAEGSATPVLSDDGVRIGAVLTLRDITARRELDRQKEEFFANASHDLRTPIATIKASVEVVLEHKPADLAEPLHRLLVNIHHESERMATLVDDLLDLTRLRAGRLRLRCAHTDLRALAERLGATIEPLAQQRGQRVVLALPPRPLVAPVDVERLERALLNLLVNAHRYGRDGGTIRLALARRRSEAVFTVADDGPGIANADRQRIFERFYRPKSDAARRSQGSGLGLPIAKAMVELHGGRIWLEDRAGQGATFHVALPLAGRSEAKA
ncbi:MAG: GAF domain-containing protein [Chloroflexi bacterium]|nr:GAF domain-containing protein [Chloroflexota bacterium]